MLIDPMLWALVLVALTPAVARRGLARRLTTASPGLLTAACVGIPLAAAALIGGTLGFIGLAVGAATLLLPGIAVLGRAQRPWLRGAAVVGVALLWTLQMSSTVPYVRWGPDDTTPFWFIDLFNRLFDPWLSPVVTGIGGAEALTTTVDLLREPVAALSHNLLGLHALAGSLVVLLLYGTIRPFAPQLAPVPPPNRWRIPPIALAVVIAGWIAAQAAPEPGPHHVLAELGTVALVGRGALLTWWLLPSGRTSRVAWVAWMALTLLVPATAWVLAALAGLETMSKADLPEDPRRSAQLTRPGHALRRWLLPAALLSAIAPAIAMWFVAPPGPGVRLPKPAGALAPAHQTAMATTFPLSTGTPLTIDRYEYPSTAGALPTTGKRPEEASALCAARGQRLCHESDFKEACSAGGRNPHMLSAETFSRFGDAKWRLRDALIERCALGSGELRASGASPECVSAVGAADLVGNAYEWVTLPAGPGGTAMWGLVGGYHGYRDLTLSSCDFTVRIHPAQVADLDLDAVGFRCCGEREDAP